MGAVGVATGAVAGLVGITPAAWAVNAMGALAIGFGAGLICFYAVELLHKTNMDAALDVFAVHGIGGIWGAIATGIFALEAITGGTKGLIEGNVGQVGIQAVGVIATVAYSGIVSFIILFILYKINDLG